MSLVEPETVRPKLISRVLRLLTRPASTWDQIGAETTGVLDLFRGYVAPLAAIPPVCMALGLLLFPVEMFDLRYKAPIPIVLAEAVAAYALWFAQVFLLALVIDLLAPPFGGVRNRLAALKLAAYSATPIWLCGVFMLLPSIGWLLAIVGALYGLMLLSIGLPRLMRPDPHRALSYFAVVLIAALAIGILAGSVLTWVSELGGPISMSVFAPQP